jgi:NAD+-dependent protein deacetylase SIR2
MFHQYMDQLAQEGRLLRHCTQNIDCLEYLLPSLEKTTVRLHGQVDEARCPKCNWKCTIDPHEFQRGPVICGGLCRDRSVARENLGRRPLGMGQLRPNIVLSGDDHPEEEEIIAMAHETLRMRPDLVLVVGTRLKIPGCRRLAEELCSDVLSRGGATVWINNSQMVPPYDFSYKFEGDCDAFAAMVS